MFSKEELLARLQNGDTAEQLADEFIAAMNEAEQAHNEETLKAEERAKWEAEKLKDTEALNAHFHDFLHKYYPDIVSEENAFSAESFLSMIENAYNATKEFEKELKARFDSPKVVDLDDLFAINPFEFFGGKPC